MLVYSNSYNLRSKVRSDSPSISPLSSTSTINDDNNDTISTTSSLSSLSTSTPLSCINNDTFYEENEINKSKSNLRKRRYSQINSESQPTTICDNYSIPKHKKPKIKVTRTVKFNLNDEMVISRSVSVTSNIERTHQRRIAEYEVPVIGRSRKHPLICRYLFWNGYQMGIDSTLGKRKECKEAIAILSQSLTMSRTKATLQTAKTKFLIWLRNPKGKLIGTGIIHIDSTSHRVNIEMFAVHDNSRGNGFASMMVYLIQYRMKFYPKYDLFVCAALSAVPFWSNQKYKFINAHPGILEQHELSDEKTGNTRHLIWFGYPVKAKRALLQCFLKS